MINLIMTMFGFKPVLIREPEPPWMPARPVLQDILEKVKHS